MFFEICLEPQEGLSVWIASILCLTITSTSEGSFGAQYTLVRLTSKNSATVDKGSGFSLSPSRTVTDNYHVEYEGFFYSVSFTFYRQQITIRATSTTIEVFNQNRERIASHRRHHTGSRYVTNPEHMPEHHRQYWDSKQWNGARYRDWAAAIGESTAYVIERMLTAQSVEEQAYKSCMGLLQMSKKYSDDRLEHACKKAFSMNSFSYTTVRNILKNGQDLVSETSQATRRKSLPVHENIRGNLYYQ